MKTITITFDEMGFNVSYSPCVTMTEAVGAIEMARKQLSVRVVDGYMAAHKAYMAAHKAKTTSTTPPESKSKKQARP